MEKKGIHSVPRSEKVRGVSQVFQEGRFAVDARRAPRGLAGAMVRTSVSNVVPHQGSVQHQVRLLARDRRLPLCRARSACFVVHVLGAMARSALDRFLRFAAQQAQHDPAVA